MTNVAINLVNFKTKQNSDDKLRSNTTSAAFTSFPVQNMLFKITDEMNGTLEKP